MAFDTFDICQRRGAKVIFHAVSANQNGLFFMYIIRNVTFMPKIDINVVIFLELNQRGVFSGPANLSRLKTQLALEASQR